MNAKRTCRLVVACFVAVLVVFSASSALAISPFPAGWTEYMLSNASNYDSMGPRVSGTRVVWSRSDGFHTQIYSFVLEKSPIADALTSDPNNHTAPQVSGDRVVWVGSDGVYDHIFTWKSGDLGTTQVTAGNASFDSPGVSGDRLAWRDEDAGGHLQVVTRKLGDLSPTHITGEAVQHDSVVVAGDRVAWRAPDGGGHLQIWTWTPSAGSKQLTTDAVNHDVPCVTDDRVAWSARDAGSASEVYVWKAGDSAPKQLTISGGGDHIRSNVQAFGDRFVWQDAYDPTGHTQIMTWKVGDASPSPLTAEPSNNVSVVISEGRVAWMGAVGAYEQIFTWKPGDAGATQLTHDAANHFSPAVSARAVVWNGYDEQSHMQLWGIIDTLTSVTKPAVSPASAKHGKTAVFTATLSAGADTDGAKTLSLYHWESKTVKQKVHGKYRNVKVHYWRLRNTVPMTGTLVSGTLHLTASVKPKYAGSWRAQVSCARWVGFDECASPWRTFKVK